MSNEITTTQIKYLSSLLKNFDKGKYESLKGQLKIAKKVVISELTRGEAYHLITKLIAESNGKDVERALTIALEKETIAE
jgi:hypothetical protein